MAKRLLDPNFRVWKDNGEPASDGSISFQLAGTSEETEVWADPEFETSLGSTINLDSNGYPETADVFGSDTISYKMTVEATGYNGSLPKTFDYIAIGETTTIDDAGGELALGNALVNGSFDANLGTRPNISGDGDGDEIAPGWYFSQPTAASNAISFPAADTTGARYACRVGRPEGSASTNPLRVWATLPTEIAYRLRGKDVVLRFSAKKGADFSAVSGLSVRLATGTSEGEDGDLIASSGFGGHANPIDDVQVLTTDTQRFEFEATLGSIKEAGLLFSYTPTGTAGADDWFQIEDVEIKLADAPDTYAAQPEIISFLLGKLSSVARTLVQQTSQALMRTTGLGLTAVGDAVATAASEADARTAIGAAPLDAPTFTTSVTLPGDPAAALQAAPKQYVDSVASALAANLGKRQRVRAATTANITIATALNNGDALDGVTLAAGDLVLVKNQSSAAENGIYVVGVTPARATEFDTYDEYPGSLITVQEGSTNADTMWLCTSNVGGTLGSTAIAFSRIRIDIEIPVTEAQGGTGSTTFGSASELRAGTASKVPAIDDIWGAAVPVVISYASSVSLNFANFFDAQITLTGDIAFGAPSNAKPGQKGVIEIVQDGSGGHSITSFDSAFVYDNGVAPALVETANARNLLHYEILADGSVYVVMAHDVKH